MIIITELVKVLCHLLFKKTKDPRIYKPTSAVGIDTINLAPAKKNIAAFFFSEFRIE